MVKLIKLKLDAKDGCFPYPLILGNNISLIASFVFPSKLPHSPSLYKLKSSVFLFIPICENIFAHVFGITGISIKVESLRDSTNVYRISSKFLTSLSSELFATFHGWQSSIYLFAMLINSHIFDK